ncbi:rhodanese-like domain-containing protein [Sneathiella sp. HT1-7]|uniref:rhodanese-like domain-containing protein n=1 Tax=Sneathiella sp. HT1-7 TaxID=2887192 RepID=UPI001D143BEC|nr:rhodanese-like domain-containing protein [Sneathiella sp. HT1-7]MCC3305900.1 rhodanese-like domain-containing protein [Sneathiella sp. HT1-7]
MAPILNKIRFVVLVLGIIPFIFLEIAPSDAADTRDQYGYIHVDASAAAQIIANSPEVIILDIRTPAEFNEGHIKNAINIDYYAPDFDEQITALDPNASYVLHCRSGGRSGRALSVLRENNLIDVTHLKGGIISWKEAGFSLFQE